MNDDIARCLCRDGSDYVGSTPGYERLLEAELIEDSSASERASFRDRVLCSLRLGGVFYCRSNELGQYNTQCATYYPHRGGAVGQVPGTEHTLLDLEREGWIERADYWGPESLERFASSTLYSWRAGPRLRPRAQTLVDRVAHRLAVELAAIERVATCFRTSKKDF